jgi:importin-5
MLTSRIYLTMHLLTVNRQNPAIPPKAAQIFHHIVLALEAETIQGQTAKKVAESAKRLVESTGINAEQVLGTLSPESQVTVKSFFS